MSPTLAKASTTSVVRVREVQEYDIEVIATGNDREDARLARHKFLDMTIDEQSGSSVGVTARTFEIGEDQFDDDELS